MKINAIICPTCGDTIYSRALHDFRSCGCGDTSIDGGFDYTRMMSKYMDGVKNVKINVNATKKELWDDWNTSKDKFGLISKFDEEIKKTLKSGKPEHVYKEKSKCCNADAIVAGKTTHYYMCTKCNQACDTNNPTKVFKLSDKKWKIWNKILKRPARIIPKLKKLFKRLKETKLEKSLKKGLKDIKEGKVTKIDNIDKMFADIDRKRKAHPIYYFFNDLYYRIYNYIEDTPLRIKTFIQRGKRGWANSDTWGFDGYLAKVISEGVKHLKKTGNTLPTWKEGKTGFKRMAFNIRYNN